MMMLSDIRLKRVMKDATVVMDGPMNIATFLAYTQQYLEHFAELEQLA